MGKLKKEKEQEGATGVIRRKDGGEARRKEDFKGRNRDSWSDGNRQCACDRLGKRLTGPPRSLTSLGRDGKYNYARITIALVFGLAWTPGSNRVAPYTLI